MEAWGRKEDREASCEVASPQHTGPVVEADVATPSVSVRTVSGNGAVAGVSTQAGSPSHPSLSQRRKSSGFVWRWGFVRRCWLRAALLPTCSAAAAIFDWRSDA